MVSETLQKEIITCAHLSKSWMFKGEAAVKVVA
jgi:hypothetical protein